MSFPKISTIASFPPSFFLENLLSLPDDSLLLTVANRGELHCLPPPPPSHPAFPRTPVLLETFPKDAWPFGLVLSPSNPAVVYLLTTDFTSQGSRKHHLRILDLENVARGCRSEILAEFPGEAKGLNGLTALSENVLLAADSFAGVIWRVDLESAVNGNPVRAKITKWLEDPLLDGELVLPDFQPGVNGVKFSRRAGVVCFSNTQKRVFAKVGVEGGTMMPVGGIEILHEGAQGDDLVIDEGVEGGPVAYLATHRDNSIIRIPIDGDGVCRTIAQGSKECPDVLGPTAGAWKWGTEGKTAYFTCDGGLKNPLAGEAPRFARVLRIDF